MARKDDNNLIKNYPFLRDEWNYVKNPGKKPEDYSFGCHEKVWWICTECGGSYERSIKDRVHKGSGLCPTCARSQAAEKRTASGALKKAAATRSFNKIKAGKSLADTHPEILPLWDHEKNILKPTEVTAGSHTEVFWRCPEGHSYRRAVKTQVSGQKCAVCSNRTLVRGVNDLATVCPQIAGEWHPEKNGELTPADIVYGSSEVVWWRCPENPDHVWKAKVYDRTANGHGCPYCKNLKINEGDNDFATLFPEIAAQWDYELNGDNVPSQFSCHSKYKAHWICGKGHRWQVSISSRVFFLSSCPECSREQRTSFPEQCTLFYVEKYFPAVKGRNSKLGAEADLFLEERKTVIEYDGEHWHRKKVEKDRKKTETFRRKGYRVIRLREKGLPDIEGSECIRVENAAANASLTDAIRMLLNMLGVSKPEIDIRKDNPAIYRRFLAIQKENSLAAKHPEMLPDWDDEKNAGLDPSCASAYSRVRIHWKCHACGKEWTATAQERSRGRHACPECRKKENLEKGRKIINLTTGTVYACLADAAASCGGRKGNICSCCRGTRQSAYGYRWAYYEPE